MVTTSGWLTAAPSRKPLEPRTIVKKKKIPMAGADKAVDGKAYIGQELPYSIGPHPDADHP